MLEEVLCYQANKSSDKSPHIIYRDKREGEVESQYLWIKIHKSQVWQHTPAIPALRRLTQGDHHEFKGNLSYIVQDQPKIQSDSLSQNSKQKKKFIKRFERTIQKGLQEMVDKSPSKGVI